MSEEDAKETGTYFTEYSPGLDNWKLAMVVLGGIAAFAGNLLQGIPYAMGATISTSIIYYLTIRLATTIYERVESIQLGIIPRRIYAAICLVSALLSIPGALVLQSPGSGVFLFFYGGFGVAALIGWGILKPLVNRAR
ncbi:hypothetical protein [Halobacterium hubeiense]|uniref:hypothetical protein n=1 Tax=Halobacterium hubeiense TaxID=1407499 RepID=UPI003C7575A9